MTRCFRCAFCLVSWFVFTYFGLCLCFGLGPVRAHAVENLTASMVPELEFLSESADLPDEPEARRARLDELFYAVQSSDPEASMLVASMYARGENVDRNYGIALALYKTAAAIDNPIACYNVAVAYDIGLGTAPDPFVALVYFEKAGSLGQHQGLYEAAQYYLSGKTGKADEKKGLKMLAKAMEAGNAVAANELGVIYARGLLEQDKDERKAVDCFIRGAELGNAEAMNNIGVAFRDGIGRTRAPAKAFKWFTIAGRFGYPAEDFAKELQASMKEEDIQAALQEVEEWLEEFQARLETGS